jgi:peptide/nickel transport system ATP-binding protein
MTTSKKIFQGSDFKHPYTEGLLHSIPRLDTPTSQRLEAIPGAVPHPLELPSGCKFAPRCKYCTAKCEAEHPDLVEVENNHKIRCFYPNERERKAAV